MNSEGSSDRAGKPRRARHTRPCMTTTSTPPRHVSPSARLLHFSRRELDRYLAGEEAAVERGLLLPLLLVQLRLRRRLRRHLRRGLLLRGLLLRGLGLGLRDGLEGLRGRGLLVLRALRGLRDGARVHRVGLL